MKASRGQCAVACTPENRPAAMDALRSVECDEVVNGDVSWHQGTIAEADQLPLLLRARSLLWVGGMFMLGIVNMETIV